MKTATKIWIIAAVALTLLGIIIFVSAMTGLKWNFIKLSTTELETTEHTVTDSYKNISVETDTADITFIATDEDSTKIVCREQSNLRHNVSVKDSTLVIELEDTRKWYEHIGFFFGSTEITVYLPRGTYGTLQIESDTGDIELPKDIGYNSIDIETDTGDVTVLSSAIGKTEIETDTGDIKIAGITAGSLKLSVSTGRITASDVNCSGSVEITVSSGKANISSLRCQSLISSGNTGDITLKNVIATERFSIERDTGDVTFDGCDAAEIFVTTDTGDVEGTLLSAKVFIARTDTGKINVPDSITGGRCEITTDTGDIKIQIP